jgi:formylglycine-generating enzyme required for sulfatase activity
MINSPVKLLDPVPWRPGLAGEYAGQECCIELGAQRVPLTFCWCPPTPPGRPFIMGSPADEPQRTGDEKQRPVEIPQGFWLAKHPIDQRQWQAVMNTNPSRQGKGYLYPVDSVSWEDAQGFCRETGLRLPKEAEWEYACRAGTATPFAVGGGRYLNAQMANFDGNHPYGDGREAFKWLYRERTLPRGSFPPNAWGLHDMHGQLREWCEDVYHGGARELRGGSWIDLGRFARSANRIGNAPDVRGAVYGFRPCPSSTQAGAGG